MTTDFPGAIEPSVTGVRWCTNPLIAWLLTKGWIINDPRDLLEQFARHMVAAGVPLRRLMCVIRTLHPQAMGIRYVWHRDFGGVKVRYKTYALPHDALRTREYLESPLAAIFGGDASIIRRRLDVTNAKFDFPILDELHREGVTDYIAMPLIFSDGQINAITFAADRPGGLSSRELETLDRVCPVLARLLEVLTTRRNAKTLLDTYLGKHTGERVLNGHIKRGDGEDIHAVIWFCDLRDSTRLADTMSPKAFLAILNEFFDCMGGAVLDHDGEILRFIGDAVLAIFPIGASSTGVVRGCCSREAACHAALAAAQDAQARIKMLNRARKRRGELPLRYGLALHMGNVMYGNIGVPERLEFTVVGAAANEAARLEGLCRTLKKRLLISSEFKRCFPGKLVSIGQHSLRGISRRQEVFTLPA